MRTPTITPYLIENLKGVRIVVIGKVDDALLSWVDIVADPLESRIPLENAARFIPPRFLRPQLPRFGRRFMQVSVRETAVSEQFRHDGCLLFRVFDDYPVQVGNEHESVRETETFYLCSLLIIVKRNNN
jgi:hypothetical protein